MKETQYSAPALEKGISIIETLAVATHALSMTEIADRLGRSKHQIYRMLVSLENLGWLDRTPDEKFFLTNRLFDLAMRLPPRRNLHEAALPVMRELSEALAQSCHLAVASGSEIVVVARMESPALLGLSVKVGHRLAITQSASGPVIFANSSKPVREIITAAIARAKTDASEVAAFDKLAGTVSPGTVLRRKSPLLPGVIDLSAPILGSSSEQGVCALTVPFLTGTEPDIELEPVIDQLEKAAARISKKLELG